MKTNVVALLAAAGLLLGCNQSVQTASEKFNELPLAVQKTVRAQAPNAEIIDVSRSPQNGQEAFEIQVRGQERNPRLVVAADGKILSSELTRTPGAIERLLTPTGATGTPLSALPQVVQRTIQSQVPNGQVAKISRHEDNNRVIYEVEFTDTGKNPTIRVAEDGTLVQSLQK